MPNPKRDDREDRLMEPAAEIFTKRGTTD